MIEMPIPDTSENSSFSNIQPAMQTAVDSTSIGEFKLCERKYYYSVLWGYQPRLTNVHLTFGLLLHAASATYHHAKAAGQGHDQALQTTIHWALRATWNSDLQRPWISNDPSKNRLSLLRAIVWYFDQFEEDPLETIVLASGKPAVELDFQADSELRTTRGEAIVICGRFDRIVRFNDRPHGLDAKTTGYQLDANFFAQFSPDNQISLYNTAGKIVFGEPIQGFIIDGIQVGANFVRVHRGLVPRPLGTLEEWWNEFGLWVQQMEAAAEARYWKMNDKACTMYGGCKFRPVCSRSPQAREQWLKADYVRRVWDPINRREDV